MQTLNNFSQFWPTFQQKYQSKCKSEAKDNLVIGSAVEGGLTTLKGLTTNLEQATVNDVVCYYLRQDEKAWQKLAERLAQASYGLLILNWWPSSKPLPPKTVVFPADLHQDFLAVQKDLADFFYPLPGDQHLLGVTGTNGKTTTVHLAVCLMQILGYPALSIGTLGVRDAYQMVAHPGGTSPSYIELRKIFYKFSSIKYFFLEVSSHALDQQRLYDLKLDHAAWPSFSQDHLDYHHTMDEYFAAKLKIIDALRPGGKVLIPATQSELKERIMQAYPTAPLLVAQSWPRPEDLPLVLQRGYNADNLALAYTWIKLLLPQQVAALDFAAASKQLNPPPGRCQWIKLGPHQVVIDYAHTPDALENILRFLKHDFPEYQVAVIFGAGGNRDRKKRPLMGQVAAAYGDLVMVTSDNPRDEDPAAIIAEIMTGIDPKTTKAIIKQEVERRAAIRQVLDFMASADTPWIALIAGKGHEEEQEIKGHKYHFSDEEVVKEWTKRGKV